MDKITELMIITMEECAELTQVCSKLLRKRNTEGEISAETRQNLTSEVADVMCMVDLMEEHGLVKHGDILEGIDSKRQKLRKWSDLIPKRQTWQEILANEEDEEVK